MQKTRRQILDHLKRRGGATLEQLAAAIGLSAVTVRAHLSVLERDDLVYSEEVRGRVGRPHFVYALTEAAQQHFPASYDRIAHSFLEGFKAVGSAEQMGLVVELVAQQWAADKAGRLKGKGLQERVSEVARIRTEEGAMAEWEQHDGGYVLRQHHCPAMRVAHGHPEICRAELEYLRILLAVPVERESFPSGDECHCSYRIAV